MTVEQIHSIFAKLNLRQTLEKWVDDQMAEIRWPKTLAVCSVSSWSTEAGASCLLIEHAAHISTLLLWLMLLPTATYRHGGLCRPHLHCSSRHARAPDDSQPEVSAAAASSAMRITIGLRAANVDAINHFSPGTELSRQRDEGGRLRCRRRLLANGGWGDFATTVNSCVGRESSPVYANWWRTLRPQLTVVSVRPAIRNLFGSCTS